MIIFGWGHQTRKQIGVTFKNLCNHCHNEDYWVLTRTITWFTLFFIPVIPYSIKYFLSCPVCQYGLTLDSKQIEQIKPLAEINQLLIDGKITQEEHQARLNQLHSGSPDPVQAEVVETKTLASADKNLSYCGGCGTTVTKELKFCGNCGTAVASK
jgi:hypothetical protein